MTDVFQDLDSLGGRVLGEISVLETQRQEIDAQIRRLRMVARAIEPDSGKPTIKRRRNNLASSNSISTIAKILLSIPDEVFTVPGELLGKVGVSDPQVYSTVSTLRDRQILGKAGSVQGGGPNGKRQAYRILDRKALEDVIAQ